MKKIISLMVVGLMTSQAYAAGYIDYTSTEEYFKNCANASFNKSSGCYVYLSGVIYTMSLYKQPCIKITDSDKDMYKKIMKTSVQYLQRQPSAKVFTSATILAHSALNSYPCYPSDKSQLMG